MKNNKKLIVVLLLTVFLITVLASASACTSKKEYKISFYAEDELIGSVVTAGREILQAFYYCSMLSSVNIPQSVQRIGEEAFASTPVIKQGQSSYLDGWLLSYYASGNTITVQDGTVGIADGQIVSSYSDITQVVLPDSLKYIGEKNSKCSEISKASICRRRL